MADRGEQCKSLSRPKWPSRTTYLADKINHLPRGCLSHWADVVFNTARLRQVSLPLSLRKESLLVTWLGLINSLPCVLDKTKGVSWLYVSKIPVNLPG